MLNSLFLGLNKMIALWKYNKITGYWVFIRDCLPENAKQWFNIFCKDEPLEQFKLSKKKPMG